MNIRARIIACICIVSVLFSLVILSETMSHHGHDPEYTSETSGVAATNGVYFSENWNGEGYIYLINSDGSVKYMMGSKDVKENQIDGFCLFEGRIYALFHSMIEHSGRVDIVYRMFMMDPDFRVLAATDKFLLNYDDEVRKITATQGYLYLTAIGGEDGDINVFEISMEDFKEYTSSFVLPGTEEEKTDPDSLGTPRNILFRDSSPEYVYVDAVYEDGVLEIRKDTDDLKGYFVPDTRVKNAVDKMHFNLSQQIRLFRSYVRYWFTGILIWLIIIIALSVALKRRNRMVYVFTITEFIFVIILFTSVFFIQSYYSSVARSENRRFASLALNHEMSVLGDLDLFDFEDKDYYRSEEYGYLKKKLTDFVNLDEASLFFVDAFIVRIKDGVILTSASGHNSTNASYEYGGQMDTLLTAIRQRGLNPHAEGDMDGVKIESTAVVEMDPSSKYALVGVYYSGSYYTGLWSNARIVLLLSAVIFLIGSMLIIFIMYLMTLDLRSFEQAIRDVALGRTKIRIPTTPSEDMKSMWSSLSELTKRIEEINYDKYRIFEGYYRFAPKNIETIMGRESIFDVKNGDVTTTEGTLMLVSTKESGYGEKRINSLKNIVSYMNQYSEREEGILVSEDSSLSILQFLFLSSCRSVSSQTTHFLHRNASDEESGFVSVFLYYGEFLYGVVGVNTQSLIFLTSKHAKEMEGYAAWFERLNIPMIVTEDIVDREDTGQVRYIGYIKLSGIDKHLRLYEVLDACSARERQLKLVNREKFEKTLELFYSRDFYLARNNFSEIIKECPDDEVAKWYLFECENYLNGGADPNESGSLKITDQGAY